MPTKHLSSLLNDKNHSKTYLKQQIINLKQKNDILSDYVSSLKNELIRNNEKLKLKIKNTKNKIDLLNYHLQKIRSSKFIKLWEKITKIAI